MSTLTTPSQAQLKQLYDSARRFALLAPWRWMDDTQVFGVKDPRTGVNGWCVVLGALGQVHGLNAYIGDRGYSHLIEIMTQDIRDNRELAVEMDCLVLNFVEKEDVLAEDWAALKCGGLRGGLTIAAQKRWPWARRIEPWRFPRALTGEECESLAVILDQACHIAERLLADPKTQLSKKNGSLLVRIIGRDGDWVDSWEFPGVYFRPTVEAHPSAQRLERIAEQSKRISETWDIDTFPLSSPVKEAEGIYYPRAVLVLDKASGMVLHVGAVKPDERDWNPVVDVILEAIESLGEVPSVIRIRNSDLHSVLKPLQVPLGVRVRRVDSLPLMDEAIDSLSQWLEKGSRAKEE